MSISASSLPKNRVFRSLVPARSIFEDALPFLGSITCNQGDLLAFDTGSNILKVVAATGDAANFLGISVATLVSGKLKSPYVTAVDASQAASDIAGPQYGCVATMKLKSGDTFTQGGKVYLADGQDAQTVSSVNPGDGNYIGLFQGSTVTASSSSEGPVLLGARYGLGSGQIIF